MKKFVIPALLLATLILAACASMMHPSATATLAPTSGQTANGTVRLTQMADGAVEVNVNLTGVPPGVHGFHIHENGDCADNGNAAGGHYNPMTTAHGAPNADPHHAGDFGNVTADDMGRVQLEFTTPSVTVEAGPNSVVGHAIILHANPDDLTTQPTGNAGGRIACCVLSLK